MSELRQHTAVRSYPTSIGGRGSKSYYFIPWNGCYESPTTAEKYIFQITVRIYPTKCVLWYDTRDDVVITWTMTQPWPRCWPSCIPAMDVLCCHDACAMFYISQYVDTSRRRWMYTRYIDQINSVTVRNYPMLPYIVYCINLGIISPIAPGP